MYEPGQAVGIDPSTGRPYGAPAPAQAQMMPAQGQALGGIFQRMLQGNRGGLMRGMGRPGPVGDFMQRGAPLDPMLMRLLQGRGKNDFIKGRGYQPDWSRMPGAGTNPEDVVYDNRMGMPEDQWLAGQRGGFDDGGDWGQMPPGTAGIPEFDYRTGQMRNPGMGLPQIMQAMRGQGGNKPNPKGRTPATGGSTTGNSGAYTLPYKPSNTDQYWKHDLWENIQNEKRKPKWQDMGELNKNLGQRVDVRSVDPELMQKLGLKTETIGDTETGPVGESGVSERIAGGEFLDQASAIKLGNYQVEHQMNRPSSKHFGKDWRPITEQDKYKVLDPKAVVWDDDLGWITHKKNYNPDGDKSWFQKNASSILPAAMGMLLGGPAGMAIGAGMAGVKAISGQTDWKSLIPALLTAGLSAGGMIPSGMLGSLMKTGLRFGAGQLINRRG